MICCLYFLVDRTSVSSLDESPTPSDIEHAFAMDRFARGAIERWRHAACTTRPI